MTTPRISASSYSNTAPLIWSFLYGSGRGSVELILDNAPARSAELLTDGRVNAALVPVIVYQMVPGLRIVPDVCVGARQRVRSVCLVTRGRELSECRSVALDVSSRTSVFLTRIIFREFLEKEPVCTPAQPDIEQMLTDADAALIIGDPALALTDRLASQETDALRIFDLAELWHQYTGLGFVFAMWMSRSDRVDVNFAAARDEGLNHLDSIVANYVPDIGLSADDMKGYLSQNISYTVDGSMRQGMELYFRLAHKHGLTENDREIVYF